MDIKAITENLRKIRNKGLVESVKIAYGKFYKKWIMPIMLREELERIEKLKLDIRELREKTLNFVSNMMMKGEQYGMYKYSASKNKPILYASCYAALIRHLYKDLDNITIKEKNSWINYIQSFQCEDGIFRDPAIKNDIAEDSDWWGWRHLTLHAIMALSALGAKPKRRFKAIEAFKSLDYTIKWLQSQDWVEDPAMTSNKVQNFFTMLQYMRDFMGEDWADKTLAKIYEWLNNNANPETGSWHVKFATLVDVSNAVQTGYHIWLLYFYDRQEPPYKKKIIDLCLKSQNSLGGFGVPLNSSACEDIDSIDPLCRLYFISDYKKEDIKYSIKKALSWVLVNLNEDGGFVFRRYEPFFYGHELMFSRKDESSMFPTWFRTLSLVYISKVLNDDLFFKSFEFDFLNCPVFNFGI
ncbi:MAG: hypothetical protein RMI01_08420 [Thermodesulfovibrio sp.]|nr:hypothetical protein [Thermodesulfovibrio sp.]